MLRSLIREIRSYPATMSICFVWAVVYLLMVATTISQEQSLSLRQLLLGTSNGDRFGSMRLAELMRGEVWRTLTSTFVHYGIVHLAMNLFGMYQLGCLIESWYGRAQFLAIYVTIGAGGNLLSGLFRYLAGSNPYIRSAGGSTVVLGLVALCAVVGWRSKTRMGDYLRGQMVKVLLLTALLGLMPIIDNWGHAGGALVGAAIGFAHRFLIRNMTRPSTRWVGAIAVVVLIGCGVAQVLADRAEAPTRAGIRWAASEATLGALVQIERAYRLSYTPRRSSHGYLVPKEAHEAFKRAMTSLDLLAAKLDRRPSRDDYRSLKRILRKAAAEPPSEQDVREFENSLVRLARHAARERDAASKEYQALSASRSKKATSSAPQAEPSTPGGHGATADGHAAPGQTTQPRAR
jgi:rhomboid protease GluP